VKFTNKPAEHAIQHSQDKQVKSTSQI